VGERIVLTQVERNPSNPWGERHIGLIDADGSDLTLIPIPADADDPGPSRLLRGPAVRDTCADAPDAVTG
jgi:hypothetical protein